MQISPMEKGVVGGFFLLSGLIMVVFHRHVKEFDESFHRGLPQFITRLRPRGALLTIFIIVFGAFSILGGIALLLVAFDEAYAPFN